RCRPRGGSPGRRCNRRLRAARLLDHRPPFHPRRTRLRWSAVVDREGFRGAFTLADRELRTLRLTIARTAQATPEQLAALCEDVALHDWLLTTVPAVVDSACGTRRGDADHGELRVVIDQLLHLWMPGTDTPPGLGEIWDRLEARPGLTRQWSACVRRVRDHLALRTLELLQDHRAARPPG
ncbi:SCO2521 family protein, partial [Streptomyces carpinensis]